jgi:hypothetical protein
MDLVNLGEASVDRQAPARAAELFVQAVGIADQIGNIQARSDARVGLARCLLLNGDPDGCLDLADAAAGLDYANNRGMAPLLAGIARLHRGEAGQAAAAFTRAITQTDARLRKTPNNYSELDNRAVALCGLAATGHRAALADAVDTFHRARHIITAPGIVAGPLSLLDQIAAACPDQDLESVRAAAAGTRTQPD